MGRESVARAPELRGYLMKQIARLLAALLSLSSSLAGATPIDGGDIVVSGTGSDGSIGLFRVDRITGAQALIAPGEFGDFSMLGTSTIYALSGGSVVGVDTATGNERVVSSGDGFVAPSGIAVDGAGRVFVLDKGALGGAGAVFEVDPSTGLQSVVTSGGLSSGSSGPTELEISPGGDLIVLDTRTNYVSEIWGVNTTTGVQTYLGPGSNSGGVLFSGTGLAVAPNGDIYGSSGTHNSTYVLKIDAVTGETTVAGHNIVAYDGTFFGELDGSDIVILDDGTGFMSGSGGFVHGVYRWDVYAHANADGTAFSTGYFNEIQIAPLAVPEPASLALFGVGLMAIGMREGRRSRAPRRIRARAVHPRGHVHQQSGERGRVDAELLPARR